MIKVNNITIDKQNFPDGTLLLKTKDIDMKDITITWLYESDAELFTIICLAKKALKKRLVMPYIPHARQDRVKSSEDTFTLKYFCEVVNSLGFETIEVLDPHSSVSEALLDNIVVNSPEKYIEKVIEIIGKDELLMFYPDEGAMKRYSGMIELPYAFGIKKRDWSTGEIKGLDVSGMTEYIEGRKILIVDDICSRGGTFYHSARKLKELGAKDIYLYISHCENTILEGEILGGELIKKVYTTNSIFTKEHEKIEIIGVL